MKKYIAVIIILLGMLLPAPVNAAEDSDFTFTEEEWALIEECYRLSKDEAAENMYGYSVKEGDNIKSFIPGRKDVYCVYYVLEDNIYPTVKRLRDLQYDPDYKFVRIVTGETSEVGLKKENGKYVFQFGGYGGEEAYNELLHRDELSRIATYVFGTEECTIWVVHFIPLDAECAVMESGEKELIVPIGNCWPKWYGITKKYYHSEEFIRLLKLIPEAETTGNPNNTGIQYGGGGRGRVREPELGFPWPLITAGILLAFAVAGELRDKKRRTQGG